MRLSAAKQKTLGSNHCRKEAQNAQKTLNQRTGTRKKSANEFGLRVFLFCAFGAFSRLFLFVGRELETGISQIETVHDLVVFVIRSRLRVA